MINETGPHSAQTPVAKRERQFGACSALFPMRSGLPAALEGHKLDRQRPAYGKYRVRGRKTMKRVIQSSLVLLVMSLVMVGFSSQGLAQAVEVEPNDPCVDAQDIGPIDLTGAFSVQESLDTPPEEPDVDSSGSQRHQALKS
jgi:hypothetical protein